MSRPGRLVALALALALLAAACGSDDDDSGGSDPETDAATEATESPETATEASEPETAAEEGEPEATPTATEEVESAPLYGGELVFGQEAETLQGWNPATTQCAISCNNVMRAVFDPLFTTRDDGTLVPFLLESAEPNDDYTEWTFTIRPGIEFHDGTPADAVAMQTHIGQLQGSALAGKILADLESVEIVDDLSVKLILSGPNALLPTNFGGQLGYLASPTQYASENSTTDPIGTGPFIMETWNPGVETVVTANPDYWRTDHVGQQLPFLEKITFLPIPDRETRAQMLATGDIDVLHDSTTLNLDEYEENFPVLVEEQFNQTVLLILNNDAPPFDNPRAREAAALCTDYDTILALRGGEATTVSNGPFGPGTPGNLTDSGYPAFDPDAGRAIVEELGGIGPVSLSTSVDDFNEDTLELITTFWSDCGIDVTGVDAVDQSELISSALGGNFQALLFRLHSGFMLDPERIWWHSDNAEGPISTNFGAIRNPGIDAALDEARLDPDPEVQRLLAEDINRLFGEAVHNIWLYYSKWLHPHDPKVQDLAEYSLPDGTDGLKFLEGRVSLAETWISE